MPTHTLSHSLTHTDNCTFPVHSLHTSSHHPTDYIPSWWILCSQTHSTAPKQTVFRERDGRDGSLVSLKIGNIGSFLQIPDLDDGVFRARGKDQAVRVKLGTCQGRYWPTHKHLKSGQSDEQRSSQARVEPAKMILQSRLFQVKKQVCQANVLSGQSRNSEQQRTHVP